MVFVAWVVDEPSSIGTEWQPGVSAQILPGTCLPRLAKVTEGKNESQGLLEIVRDVLEGRQK